MNALEARRIIVLYGSQTGTAQDLAERIGNGAKRHHFFVRVSSMDDYPVEDLIREKLVIFVCSTTGQGEEPENMKRFWKFLLRKNLPHDSLDNTMQCVIGLGDSSYQKFNFVAKRLHKRLIQLGGTPIMPLVLGDDQHEFGPDGLINPWLEQFWKKLLEIYPLPSGMDVISDNVLQSSRYRVEFLKEWDRKPRENNAESAVNGYAFDDEKDGSESSLIGNSRITSYKHFQDVRQIRLDIKDCSLSWTPGDVAVIKPKNLDENVTAFLKLLNVSPEEEFILLQNDSEVQVPSELHKVFTVRRCVKEYWDIQSVPRRSFFELLRHFSQSELEKEKLLEFCQAEGQEELYSYCNRPRRSILEVMQDFPHTTPYVPFEYLFDLIPSIKPRSFSIASSPIAHPGEIHLLVAVVKYKTKLYTPRQGLCSNWLASLDPKENVKIPLSIKHGSISLPPSDKPVIMVGPGTGCAPFRGFIHERCARGIGQNYLFFGCRNKEGDFLFESEWTELVERNLLHLFTAFSRDQEHKIYVQHRMIENKELLWDLINNQEAWIYIAGNAKRMPQDVRCALLTIIQEGGCLARDNAEEYLKTLEKKKRLQCEVWS